MLYSCGHIAAENRRLSHISTQIPNVLLRLQSHGLASRRKPKKNNCNFPRPSPSYRFYQLVLPAFKLKYHPCAYTYVAISIDLKWRLMVLRYCSSCVRRHYLVILTHAGASFLSTILNRCKWSLELSGKETLYQQVLY